MLASRWLVLGAVTVLAASCDAQVESWLPLLRPDHYFEFRNRHIITFIMRATELLQGIVGSYRGELRCWSSIIIILTLDQFSSVKLGTTEKTASLGH